MTALLVEMERSSATLLGDNLDIGAVALLLATAQPGDGSEVRAITLLLMQQVAIVELWLSSLIFGSAATDGWCEAEDGAAFAEALRRGLWRI